MTTAKRTAMSTVPTDPRQTLRAPDGRQYDRNPQLAGLQDHSVDQVIFSIIIPCYRAGATISEALESVLMQTDQDFEVLVVEDGCPDQSGRLALQALGTRLDTRLIQQRNAGPGAARNAGAQVAKGILLAFLDSDDRWDPEYLAHHRAAFVANSRLGVSFAKVRFCDGNLTWGGRVSGIVGPLALADALGDNPTCTTSNLVIHRDAFWDAGGFNTQLRHAEDQDFVIRLLLGEAWRVCGLDEALVDYRMSQQGLSADLDGMEAGWLAMLARASTIAPAAVARVKREAQARFYRYLARRALRTGQSARVALGLFCRALVASPIALLRHQPGRSAQTALGILAALVLPDRLIRPLVAR